MMAVNEIVDFIFEVFIAWNKTITIHNKKKRFEEDCLRTFIF